MGPTARSTSSGPNSSTSHTAHSLRERGCPTMALTRTNSTGQNGAAGPFDTTLLDHVLPYYDYGGSARVVIHAPPAAIFRALRTVTLAEMPLAYVLGTIRYLPGRL